MELPLIVVEIEGGFVRGVYFNGMDADYAVFDRDQEEIGDDSVQLGSTEYIDDLPPDAKRAVDHACLEEAFENKSLVIVTNEASDNVDTVGLIVNLDEEHGELRDTEGGEVGLFEAWELKLYVEME